MTGRKWKNCFYTIREKWNFALTWRLLGLAAGIFCYLLAVGFYQDLCEGKNLVTVQLTGVLPNGNEADKICELELEQEAPIGVVFWNTQGEQQVSNPALERSTGAELSVLRGDPGIYLPGLYGLSGDGCILDETTARELFGSRFVVGNEITVNGADYRIEQVLDEGDSMILYRGVGEELTFSMVNLQIPEGESVSRTVNNFLTRYQLTGSILDNTILFAVGKAGLLLWPFLMAGQMLRILAGEYQSSRGNEKRRILWAGILLAAGLLFLAGVSSQISLSLDMIPSRWSDFGFWTSRLQEKMEGLSLFIRSAKSPGQVRQLSALARSFVCSVLSCVCYLTAVRSKRRRVRSPEALPLKQL
ncbi:MAG TPA: ABC transporter permease [Candidatus Blautia gallistercoris]|uniref:ABC transporter permease n=1 Tax=Candidatus Blautia gallistercoris TaxID=2838490 RepID=A0A9D1WIU1_9FIRM|nr:ABC transporter permease [Candidatus Blautia gallistercoris]